MNKLQAIVAPIVLSAGIIFMLFFTEPASLYIVVVFILLATLLTFTLSNRLRRRKYQYLITLFVFSLLTMNYLAGFQVLNTILLISIIIGLAVLVK